MKKINPILLAGLMLAATTVFAQYNEPPPLNQESPGRADIQQEEPPQPQPLSAEQKAAVKAILSRYKASSLTAEDARAIHTAFRKAGIRRGPGLPEAIKDAGFDPEKLRSLDPPPDRPGVRNHREGMQPLTKEQVAKVMADLSKNNITTLSEKDIQTIHKIFQEEDMQRDTGHFPPPMERNGEGTRRSDSHGNNSQGYNQDSLPFDSPPPMDRAEDDNRPAPDSSDNR